MPRKVFVAGEILTAADVNTNLMDQAVMVFADSAARGSAIPTPSEGMVTYLSDTNQVQAYNGAAFAPLGTILQVVQVVLPTTFSSASTSYTDVIGLAASITPSATSSKILVTFDNRVSQSVNDGTNRTRLLRNSTAIYIGTASGSLDNEAQGEFQTGGRAITTITGTFLDSPNTTSSVTYKIQMKTSSGTFFVNRNDNDTTLRPASSVTLMEVAG